MNVFVYLVSLFYRWHKMLEKEETKKTLYVYALSETYVILFVNMITIMKLTGIDNYFFQYYDKFSETKFQAYVFMGIIGVIGCFVLSKIASMKKVLELIEKRKYETIDEFVFGAYLILSIVCLVIVAVYC